MTACVKNHSRRVALAVSASLVGALSLGAATVPAVYAEGISTQFVEGGTSDNAAEFADGSVDLSFSKSVTQGTDTDGNMTVSAQDVPFTVTATNITPAGTGVKVPVTPGHDYKVALYKADENKEPTGSPLSGNRVTEAGDYVLTVTPLTGSDYVGQTFKQYFKIVPVQISVNGIYENAETGDNFFQFTGSPINVEFTDNDGNTLVEGVDYTVKFTKVADYGSDQTGIGKTTEQIEDAGQYTATLTGLGKYEGTSYTTGSGAARLIDVQPYTFTKMSGQYVVIDPFTGSLPEHPSRVYWDDANDARDTELDPTLLNITNNSGNIDDAGNYMVNIEVDSDALNSGNVIDGRAAGDHDGYYATKMDAEATLLYHGQPVQDAYDVYLGTTDTFGDSDFKAVNGGTALTEGDVKVTGSVNTNAVGVYTITVTYNLDVANGGVNAGLHESSSDKAVDGRVFAASKTITVHVWAGQANADTDLYVYGPEYTGQPGTAGVAITSYAKAFDGSELRPQDFFVVNKDRTVSNYDLDEANSAMPNLSVTFYDADGNEVDGIVDAGSYTMKVTSDTYKLSGTTEMPITVGKVDLNSAEIGEIELWNDVAGQEYLPVDGNDLTIDYSCGTNASAIQQLGLVYETGNDGASYDEDDFAPKDFAGQDLLPDCVDVTIEFNDEGTWKPVANVNEEGQYRAILTVGEDIASNFEGSTKTIEFTAARKALYSDVQPSDWCYDAVIAAARNGYMNGYSGTTNFGPWDKLTRGQVAMVLYNMSGASRSWNEANETNGSYDETEGWVTGFGDVDGHMYYAKAIAWAKSVGVVEGYKDGSGKFGPDDPVTREQFAQMMANYARVVNRDETVGQDNSAALAEMADASEVSGWARDAVAWAVANDVMGSQGTVMPQDTMDRAMCATMVTNYQPKAK